MVPGVNIFHNVTGAGNRPQMLYNLEVPNKGTHPMIDTERHAELQERLKEHNAILGGGETLSELQTLLEEIEGEAAYDSNCADFYSH